MASMSNIEPAFARALLALSVLSLSAAALADFFMASAFFFSSAAAALAKANAFLSCAALA